MRGVNSAPFQPNGWCPAGDSSRELEIVQVLLGEIGLTSRSGRRGGWCWNLFAASALYCSTHPQAPVQPVVTFLVRSQTIAQSYATVIGAWLHGLVMAEALSC
jgi:hypothetical protein